MKMANIDAVFNFMFTNHEDVGKVNASLIVTIRGL